MDQTKADANWWRGAVIYQIYPRSFQDSNGDGIGDLAGITARLEHVAALGVDAIWLSPFFTSPMKDMGYDVSDYCDVDPVFGTLADFDALIAKAHGLGLKVMIDQVLSHTSDQHPWFLESKGSRKNNKADWYVWADARPAGDPPTNWQSVFGGSAWTWHAGRRQYYLHNFLASQPDLNFHNPDVQSALLATVAFWLERGVDGFRLDTVNYYVHDQRLRDNPGVDLAPGELPAVNPYGHQQHLFDKTRPENIGFLKKFRALLDRHDARAAVGEVGDESRSLKTMAEYTSGGDRLHMCYSFDMLGPNFSPAHYHACITQFDKAALAFGDANAWPCWAFSNHDVNRHVSRFENGFLPEAADRAEIAKVAASLLLSLRGSICLYQGEELGLPEADIAFEDLTDPAAIAFWPDYKGRDGCRTPYPWERDQPNAGFSRGNKTWLPVPMAHVEAAASTQRGVNGSVLEHYRAFLAFRKTEPALIHGDLTFVEAGKQLLAFTRKHEGKVLLCVFNLSNKQSKIALSKLTLSKLTLSTLNLPKGTLTPIAAPGSNGQIAGATLKLAPFGSFFAAVG
jgi:alpha-glucosidase